ncbi:MAG: hypothetical protein PHE51_08270 [Eubacteriales bacterium]|nr:hypothetical protein [Eubacteriales bacterium]
MGSFETEIHSSSYTAVEQAIANHYDMGYINTSSLPQELSDGHSGTYFISGVKKQGDFYISVSKFKDGTIQLSVSDRGLKNKR